MTDMRVLVIDQDIPTINFLDLEFKKLGINLLSANKAKEGLILAYQHRPQVIIIDPIMQSDQDFREFLEKIRNDRRLSKSKIIAFSSLTSPEEIQAVIDLGFFEFLNKEAGTVQLLIRKTLEAANISDNETIDAEHAYDIDKPAPYSSNQLNGKSIVFLSGKGGIGTSSLCANIAHLSNIKLDHQTTVVDLVLPIGSLASIVGFHGSADIIEASKLGSIEDLTTYLKNNLTKPRQWNFKFLAGAKSPSHAEQLNISQVFILINILKNISDFVFIDIGKTLSRISLPIIKSADQIVLTLSLDQTTVEHTKTVWEFLRGNGVEQNQIYFLINRAVGLEGLSKTEVESILGTVIQLTVPYMGSNFTLANNLHQPVSEKFPQDAVSISLRQASDEIFQKIEQRTTRMDFF